MKKRKVTGCLQLRNDRGRKMKIAVIGGGASGLMAAVTAADAGADVTIYERNDRVGKKILATGNGKCNFSNRQMSMEQYYGSDLSIPAKILKDFTPEDAARFFERAGMLSREKNGYLYPYSEQASTVLDIFRILLKKKQIRTVTEHLVSGIYEKNGMLTVLSKTENGTAKESFDRVIVCCGGKAAPKTGSDGNGFSLLSALGHTVVPVVPALVQLKAKETFLKSISGVRAECRLTLLINGKKAGEESGEMQFTDYGISGIVTFQLSRLASYAVAAGKKTEAYIDLFPRMSGETFAQTMRAREKNGSGAMTAEEFFTGLLNKKVTQLFLKLSGIAPDTPLKKVSPEKKAQFYSYCKKLAVTITGTNSFDQAQVSAGGVPFSEVNAQLASKKVPGLYLAGEILDIDGKCGGYNLHWAWASGYTAGKQAAETYN